MKWLEVAVSLPKIDLRLKPKCQKKLRLSKSQMQTLNSSWSTQPTHVTPCKSTYKATKEGGLSSNSTEATISFVNPNIQSFEYVMLMRVKKVMHSNPSLRVICMSSTLLQSCLFWGQFHQYFTRTFFVQKFVQSQTLSREKLLKRLS